MQKSVLRRSRRSLALVPVALLVAACSASVKIGGTDGAVAEKDVEQQAAEQLAATVDNGVTPTIDCPGDLAAKVGTVMNCTLTVEGDTTELPVAITVTAVKDGKVDFDIQVGK